MIQAQTRGQVLEGVQQYGLAPGARKMIDAEEEAAQLAMETGIYGVWRSSKGTDCTRIGPSARCFCNHSYADHFFVSPKSPYPICKACSCRAFAFVPSRPEEVGEWWLPRRKGFNVHTWRAKCRCGHGHDEHDPNARRCRCGCSMFRSNFACLACDLKWEDHETVFENAQERLMSGRAVGEDFRPLADDAAIRGLVFPEGPGAHTAASAEAFAPNSLRRAQVPVSRGEKAVRIMAASSGGAVADQPLANRWGKVANPPAWPPSRQQLEGGQGSGSTAIGGPSAGFMRRPGGGPAFGATANEALGTSGRIEGSGGGGSRGAQGSPGRRAGRGAGPGCVERSRVGSSGGGVVAETGVRPGTGMRPGSVGGRPSGRGAGGGMGVVGAAGGQYTAAAGSSGVGRGAGTGPKPLASGFRPVYD